MKVAPHLLYYPYSCHLLIIKQGHYKLKGMHIPNLQKISWLLASLALLISLALSLVLLALSPSVSKSRSAISSLIIIGFTTSHQNYIFRTAGERGRVIK
jgi:hypothetical protein